MVSDVNDDDAPLRASVPTDLMSLDVTPTTRRLIAVGGGKGGVGKSLVAMNLATYLAQLGKRVVLVDADPTGANIHLWLDVERPGRRVRSDGRDGRDGRDAGSVEATGASLVATSVAGLRLLPAPFEASATGALKGAKRARLLQVLKAIAADYVIVDTGPGVSTTSLDLFSAADFGVLVTIPEPSAIETTYRFVRALFAHEMRRLLRHERMRLRVLDRVLSDFDAWPIPLDFARHLARVEPPLGELAADVLTRLRPRLVVNQARVRTDFELGGWLAHVSSRRLGIRLDPLGHIEHDDAVWLANRRRKPLLVDGPSSKAGRGLERVARRLIAVLPQRAREVEARNPIPTPLNHYDRLQVPRGASEEEVRKALKRQREIYAEDGLPVLSIFGYDELAREHALLDEAHDVLVDPQRRRAYDVSIFPNHEAGPTPPSPSARAQTEAVVAELLQMQAAIAKEVGPDTEFSGELLRRVRESKGIEVRDVSAKTKISASHVTAIETEAFHQLPPLVYVRGFLVAIAKFLGLDPSAVARTYLRRARDLLDLRGESNGG